MCAGLQYAHSNYSGSIHINVINGQIALKKPVCMIWAATRGACLIRPCSQQCYAVRLACLENLQIFIAAEGYEFLHAVPW